ncbi:MAG: HNH endonuclease [Ilumatobacteraceae bacterium]
MPNFPNPKIERKARAHNYRNPLYNTTAWRRLRAAVLREQPLCVHCTETGATTLAQMVDHIFPVRLGGDMWALDNLQPLCNKCHARKSAREQNQFE